jgi:hypothetical protein
MKTLRIGETDESNPAGIGYMIQTREGLKVFDLSEHEDFLREKERVQRPRRRRKLRLPLPGWHPVF